MNTLTQMFQDETQPRSLTDAEVLYRIADGTVTRAKRRRAVRVGTQSFVTLLVVGVAAVIGANLLTHSDAAPPAASTSPVPTAPVILPASDPDSRLPQAPPMTDADWGQVATSWDVEFASFLNIYPQTTGSTVAMYLTPPDGERKLAYSAETFPDEYPSLLGFEPDTKSALIYSPGKRTFLSLDFETGVMTDVALRVGGTVRGAAPLGRASDGISMFYVETVATDGEITSWIYRLEEGSAIQVRAGQFDVSPVWGEQLVVYEGGVLSVMDAAGVASSHELPALYGCQFQVWNADGTFTVICPTSQDRTGDYYSVNTDTGAMEVLWADADLESLTTDLGPLTEFNWIDSVRRTTPWWSGPGIPSSVPPVVHGPDDAVADLSEGFLNTPDTYQVVFGARG